MSLILRGGHREVGCHLLVAVLALEVELDDFGEGRTTMRGVPVKRMTAADDGAITACVLI
jgi:hypothetical protein